MRQKLRFRQDGTFTIAQFTDLHWIDGSASDSQTRSVMELVLDTEKPDFVMFTGDVIYTGRHSDGSSVCENPIAAIREAVDAVERRAVPWGIVFGNHDTENGITRSELMDEVLKHRYTLAERGPEHIQGVGNYVLPIVSSNGEEATALLYCLDSGAYSEHPQVTGYDWIRQNQVQWFMKLSQEWKDRHQGKALPALAFFHIPLQEYQTMWNETTCYGHKFEPIAAARVQAGFFEAMLQQGDVMATFCGHDHINDFWGELHGIRLYYGRATGFNTYGKEGFPRGARLIRLFEGERTLHSWLRLDDGSMIEQQPEHRPGE